MRADCLRADLLYAIRRRRQEILTQLAVTTQGYAALRIVEERNEGMVHALATATTTTAAALRTAVMVAQAVAGQRMAAQQIEAAGAAAADMAEDAGALVERQSAAVKDGLDRAARAWRCSVTPWAEGLRRPGSSRRREGTGPAGDLVGGRVGESGRIVDRGLRGRCLAVLARSSPCPSERYCARRG